MPIKILVVDDEADLRVLMTQKFRTEIRNGEFHFLFAADGLDALVQLEAHPEVYVVLSDINMPRMDGLALLSVLTERYPLIRMIILSAYGDMQNIRTAMNRGAYDFLTKPINFHDLEVTLRRTIRHVEQAMQEIAARKQIEGQVLQLKKAVENMQLGVTVVNLDGRILYCNPAEARMHGYEQFELLGQNVGVLAPPELRQPVRLEDIRRWKGLVRESVNIRKDGSRFLVWLMSEIVKDAEGEPTAIVTTCEDITERKKAEAELEQHREHLEELVRERTLALTTANEHLQQEIAERARVEMELRATYQNLKQLNERLQTELLLARKIQQGLLPPPDPGWRDVEVVCYSSPAYEVGGDFYAYHAFGDAAEADAAEADAAEADAAEADAAPDHAERGQYALAVGDVSGKGMPAALLMAVSLASFQESVSQRLNPEVLLKHLDETIIPYTRTTTQNCALLYVELTLPDHDHPGMARCVNAGCITPILRRRDGAVEWVDVRGMPLGLGWGPSLGYQEAALPLNPGDMLILTSDGVVEARDAENELLGFERLEAFVQSGPSTSAGDMLAHLQAALNDFLGSAELRDDVTIVVARIYHDQT
jgi:PAS domain S-box-containing protein